MSRNKQKSIRVRKLKRWVEAYYLHLAFFNVFLVLLLLLRSASYFEPYFPLTINIIFILSLTLSVFLFRLSARNVIIVAIFFWLLTALFRILKIEVWAERAALYSYESLVMSILIMLYESLLGGRRLAKPKK